MIRYTLVLTLIFYSTFLPGQTPVGNYVPSGQNVLSRHFRLIPKYEILQINLDSTYYYENFWGSFVESESGTWRMFGDTLFTYKTSPIGSKASSPNFDKYVSKNDSFPNKTRITITDTKGTIIPSLRLIAYMDSIIVDTSFNENGTYLLDYSRFDTVFILGNKYNHFDIIRVFPECCFKNDYTIVLNQGSFIVKKNRIQNLSRKTIFHKQ